MSRSLPTRQISKRPDLDQIKRQAKELLHAFVANQPDAVAEVRAHYHDANPATFALHDAQLVIARSSGFDSWPKLKAYVDGVTVTRLRDAILVNDFAVASRMLRIRPELGRASLDNLQLLHHAVLKRSVALVRLLMQHGANARDGIYPHREATTALTLAFERGDTAIVEVIREEEQRQREQKSGVARTPEPDQLFKLIAAGDDAALAAALVADPALIVSRHPVRGVTALHVAAYHLRPSATTLLLAHGADAMARDVRNHTPLDWAAYQSSPVTLERFREVTQQLLARGAPMTATAAVACGDVEWLRDRHTAGVLTNPIEDGGGLLRIAVTHDRAEVLAMLLEFGFDPDERMREVDGDEQMLSWGMPLWHCAGGGKHELAEMLLKHGADPNAAVAASGDPVFQAYSERDWRMVQLLEQYGGIPTAGTAALYRQTELARAMLTGGAKYRLEGDASLAEQLLHNAACGGDPEIVRMALPQVDWARDDPRWFGTLEQPLRLWAHGSGSRDWDRSTYFTCFRLLLERADPNIRGRVNDKQQFGLTILHSIAGSREHLTAADRLAFATVILDAGARLDCRDHVLKSTPLGWACRWGREELVKLFLARGADPIEADAEPWATPRAWAEKMGRADVLALLGT